MKKIPPYVCTACMYSKQTVTVISPVAVLKKHKKSCTHCRRAPQKTTDAPIHRLSTGGGADRSAQPPRASAAVPLPTGARRRHAREATGPPRTGRLSLRYSGPSHKDRAARLGHREHAGTRPRLPRTLECRVTDPRDRCARPARRASIMRAQLLEDCTAMASDPLAPVAQATTRTTACQSSVFSGSSFGRREARSCLRIVMRRPIHARLLAPKTTSRLAEMCSSRLSEKADARVRAQ